MNFKSEVCKKKTFDPFFLFMFQFWDILFLKNCVPFFSCKKTFLNMTHDRKGIYKILHTVNHSLLLLAARVRLFYFEKILFTESVASRSSDWANIWQIFCGDKLWEEISVTLLVDLSNVKFLFEKMKSFLIKGFIQTSSKRLIVFLIVYSH